MKSRAEKSTNPTFFTTIEQREDEKNDFILHIFMNNETMLIVNFCDII